MARKRPGASDQFPPVGFVHDLAGWSSPQYLPGSPHRLPPPNQRVKFPSPSLLADGTPVVPDYPGDGPIPPILTPPLLPNTGPLVATSDPHHYADVRSLYIAAVLTVTSNVPILQQSDSKRNFLMFRNAAASGGPNIFIAFGQPADATSVVIIVPGQMILFDEVVPQNDVYAFASGAAAGLSVGFSTIPNN